MLLLHVVFRILILILAGLTFVHRLAEKITVLCHNIDRTSPATRAVSHGSDINAAYRCHLIDVWFVSARCNRGSAVRNRSAGAVDSARVGRKPPVTHVDCCTRTGHSDQSRQHALCFSVVISVLPHTEKHMLLLLKRQQTYYICSATMSAADAGSIFCERGGGSLSCDTR